MRGLMRGFSARLCRVRSAGERGAIGVTVGVLFGTGVMIGVGALVVDVGQLYQERAELQNGADAAAIAVARGCARGATTCLPATAATYANANAKDGAAAVNLVCGSAGAGVLPACPAPGATLASCPAPQPSANYVEVHTSTRTPGGSTLLPPAFARGLAGNEGYQGTNVGACARASWGSPQSATAFGFTISYCEWMKATNQGTTYAPAPPYPPNPSSSLDRVLRLHGTSHSSCPSGPSGYDAPGAFGWVKDDNNDCSVPITGTTYKSDPGTSASNGCKAMLATVHANRSVVFVPVYTKWTGTGANTTYTLAGFGAFVVTGYRISGATGSDWLKSTNNCTGSSRCINGVFTRALLPPTGTVGGPDLGASIVKLTG